MSASELLANSKRVVIKIGSALLVDTDKSELRQSWLTSLAEDIQDLRWKNIDVIIVSSGAIALGRTRLGRVGKSLSLGEKQACAAAGQAALTRAYEDALAPLGYNTAQALLTLMDTENRQKWLNARTALETLLGLGVIPIINENDTVATDEIRYGDNDRLAARVAQMMGADMLILLSDIDGLYSADPRSNPTAKHIALIKDITPKIRDMGGDANIAAAVGTGGMASKISAAEIAMNAGCHTIVTQGDVLRPISALKKGARHSHFMAKTDPVSARKQWISGALKPKGRIEIDAGALKALQSGRSLLPAGISAVTGTFQLGDAVYITFDGAVIAKGLSAYSSADVEELIGAKSDQINSILGYDNGKNIIHRDNLVMLNGKN